MPRNKKKMKAAILYAANKINIEEVPIPEIREDEVLVKVKNVGICGSDLSYYFGRSPIDTKSGKGPIILGHEIAGKVEKIGKIPERLKLFKDGEKVLVNPIQNCNICKDCLEGNINTCINPMMIGINVNGGFAEYCKAKFYSIYKLPKKIGFNIGALIEPIACAIQGLDKLSIKFNQFIIIIGDGPIGIILSKLIRKMGSNKILLIGKHDFRMEKAKEFGASFLINMVDKKSKYFEKDIYKKIKMLNSNNNADRTILATGAKGALDIAVNTIGNNGKLVIFGLFGEDAYLKIPILRFLTMNQEVNCSWCAPYSWPTAIKIAEENSKDFQKLITHSYSLEEIEQAINELSSYSDNQIKTQITF